ncbi:YALIA101S01e21902g1_1 [Yarrowia lipolytica]|nr:YALIA101S01e21902g1_1 [Yarrowia lipolytica]
MVLKSIADADSQSNPFSALAPEIIHEILSHLDIPSVCALSHTNTFLRSSVTEDQFKLHLTAVCPWFDPDSSRFNTFKECTFEYLRRMSGKKFAPCLDNVSTRLPVEDMGPSVQSVNGYVEMIKVRNTHKFSDNVYISKYGIRVNLGSLEMWSAPDFQYIISLPQLFATIIGHRCTQYVLGQLLLQYRDEDHPRIYDLPDCDDYRMIHCGKHVFVYTIKWDLEYEYPEDKELLLYVSEDGLRQVMVGIPSHRPNSVYDGYFFFTDDNNALCFAQAGLDGLQVIDRAPNRRRCDFFCDSGKTGHMFVQDQMGNSHLWDMARHTMHLIPPSYRVQTSDVPIFLTVPYPGIDSVDLEMAEAQDEVPIEPERAPFALFASLHHLAGIF